jgi:hypothetical protein
VKTKKPCLWKVSALDISASLALRAYAAKVLRFRYRNKRWRLEVFHNATGLRSRLKLWNESGTNRARIADSVLSGFVHRNISRSRRFRPTRSCLEAIGKRRSGAFFLNSSEASESNQNRARVKAFAITAPCGGPRSFVSVARNRLPAIGVMAGLDPGHEKTPSCPGLSRASTSCLGAKRVDGRVKPGHDDSECRPNPHPEEARSAISKDEGPDGWSLMRASMVPERCEASSGDARAALLTMRN